VLNRNDSVCVNTIQTNLGFNQFYGSIHEIDQSVSALLFGGDKVLQHNKSASEQMILNGNRQSFKNREGCFEAKILSQVLTF